MNIMKEIESALISKMNARTYVSANSIPICEFRDNSKQKANFYAIVHVSPAGRLSPNYQKYRLPVEIICVSYTPKDTDRADLETLYGEAFEMINTVTPAELTAALPDGSKITIDGIVPDANGGEEDIQDNFQVILAKAEIFATYTP